MPDLVADGVDRHGGNQVLAAHRGSLLKYGFGTRHHLRIPGHRGQSFRRIADSVPVIADSF
jgi:hypothetical protein